MNKFLIGLISSAVVILVVGGIVVGGLAHVSVGNVGIEKHTDGQVTDIGQGWKWVGYGVSVQEYPTYMQSLILSDNPKEGSNTNDQWQIGTGDQQEIPVNTSLTWAINPSNATALYQYVGGQDISYVRDKIVEPTMKSVVNRITHDYGWSDIKGAKQGEVTDKVNQALSPELDKLGIKMGKFAFTYVGTPKGMDAAQQALAQSDLQVKQAEQSKAKAQIDNETLVMNAQAQAQANQIEAQGIKAKADAMNALTVQEDAIAKWDGKMPSTYAGGNMPFINMGQTAPAGK